MHTLVARQPIFKAKGSVYAYELLFRSGAENVFPDVDGDQATSAVISDSFFSIGIDALTGGKKAFINFTREILLKEYALLLPRESVVVEILEDVTPDEEVLKAVRRLKGKGYTIALDDYGGSEHQDPFVELADVIKVDFLLTTAEQREGLVRRLKPLAKKLLAEKVETHEEFNSAKQMGYSLFQGFFFCKPSVVNRQRIPESKVSKMRLLQAVNEPTLDYGKVEEAIKHDVSFSYKLLQYINSAFFCLRHEVENLQQAMVIMGEKNLRKWASLMAFASLGTDKPPELLVTAVVRGRFCEELASQVGMRDRTADCFLMGMFSTIDALLDMPMDKALESVPLASDIRAALLGRDGVSGKVLDVALTYEKGDWHHFEDLREELELEEEAIPKIHLDAVKMAEQVLQI